VLSLVSIFNSAFALLARSVNAFCKKNKLKTFLYYILEFFFLFSATVNKGRVLKVVVRYRFELESRSVEERIEEMQ
jgi:archaellum biogenesis protein FlaJ (TadC family)